MSRGMGEGESSRNQVPSGTNDLFKTIRSDSLRDLRTLFAQIPGFERLARVLQLEVIVDANIVVRDLIWLTRTRRSPEARTNLQEIIAAGTVIPRAPKALESELLARIPDIAEREGIPVALLVDTWTTYRAQISFEDDIPLPDGLVRDPKDLPYVVLQQKTGSVILTEDKDLRGMGADTIGIAVVARLKDYSRSAAVEFTVLSGLCTLAVIPLAVIAASLIALRRAWDEFRKLPTAAQGVVVAMVILVLMHPRTRDAIKASVQSISETLQPVIRVLLGVTAELMLAYQEKRPATEAILAELERLGAGTSLQVPQ